MGRLWDIEDEIGWLVGWLESWVEGSEELKGMVDINNKKSESKWQG